MIARIWEHAGALGTALARFIRHPFAAFFEVLVLGIALSLPVGLLLVVETVQEFAAQLPRDPEVSIFLNRNVARAQRDALEKRLSTLPAVAEVAFIGRGDAANHLRQSAGMAEVLDALPENPLPDAFTLRLKSGNPAHLDALRTEVATWPGVDIVQADSGWAHKLESGLRVARTTALLLAVLFGMAALTVTFNTVRLQMLGKRDEIQLSRLIGATDVFVRRPFVYFGALQGLFGGAAALAIVGGAGYVLAHPLTDFAVAYGLRVRLPTNVWIFLGIFLGATLLLGAAASWIAATRHLWARDVRPASHRS